MQGINCTTHITSLKQAESVYTAVSSVTLLHKRTAAFRSVGHALGKLYSLKSYVENFHAQMSSTQSNERTMFFKDEKNSCPMQSHRARCLSFVPVSQPLMGDHPR